MVAETVSDAASNFGGWQGGFPGTGDPLKGLRSGGGKNDVGKIQRDKDVKRTGIRPSRSAASDTFRLSKNKKNSCYLGADTGSIGGEHSREERSNKPQRQSKDQKSIQNRQASQGIAG